LIVSARQAFTKTVSLSKPDEFPSKPVLGAAIVIVVVVARFFLLRKR
jgi:hypothetical protein